MSLSCPCVCGSAVSHHDLEAGQKVGGGSEVTNHSNYGSRFDRRNGYLCPNLLVLILYARKVDVLAVNEVREVHHPVEADRVILQVNVVFEGSPAIVHECLIPDPHHISIQLRKSGILVLRPPLEVLRQDGSAGRQHQLDGVRVHLSRVLIFIGRCIWILRGIYD